MTIEIICPSCGKRWEVPDKFAGKRAKCRMCSGPIPVPVPEPDDEASKQEPFAVEPPEPAPTQEPTGAAVADTAYEQHSGAGPVRCKICGRGTVRRRKVYRMSGAIVAIGYILLIPSILGVVLNLVLLALPVVGFAPSVNPLGGGAIIGAILCFVFGLLGWLLVMKKKELQCDSCQAVVVAS
ncbi:MAG: hypothetical protein ACYS15_06390 [Planctomycetota bacterium]|jgi:hypothetical protein